MIVSMALTMGMVFAVGPKPAEERKATHTVEWKDAAGDVQAMSTSDGEKPGFDVVELALASDGSRLTISSTLAGPLNGDFAGDVVQIYIDGDNDEATGVETVWGKKPGFEMVAKLSACITYDNGKACSGGLGGKVLGYSAVASLDRFKGTAFEKESIVGSLDAPQVPIAGALVSASLPYEKLGVKSGQKIRLVARESCGPFDASADFPAVVLTLE